MTDLPPLHYLLAVGFLILLLACSQQNAGGSSGTDNPAIAVVSPQGGLDTMDTVRIQVWEKDQNPLIDSLPVLDTLVAGGVWTPVDVTYPAADYNVVASNSAAVALGGTGDTLLLQNTDTVQVSFSRSTTDSIVTVPDTAEAAINDMLSRAEWVYIPGTPWYSQVQESVLVFVGVPSGTYQLVLVDAAWLPLDTIPLVIP